MSKKEKLLKRFLSKPADFEFNELVILLKMFDFELISGGKTSGSACKFRHKNEECIFIHKPHPKLILKSYQINLIIKYLKEMNLIWKIF